MIDDDVERIIVLLGRYQQIVDEVDDELGLQVQDELELVVLLIYVILAIEVGDFLMLLDEIVVIYVEIFVYIDLQVMVHLQ